MAQVSRLAWESQANEESFIASRSEGDGACFFFSWPVRFTAGA